VTASGSITAAAGTLTVAGIASTATITGSGFSSVISVGSITASAGTLTVAGITTTGAITGTTMSLSETVTSSSAMYATAFITPSDRRLKANVASLDMRAKDIFRLNGVSFNYKRRRLPVLSEGGDSSRLGEVARDGVVDLNVTHFGFIAQEVELDFPELVDRSADGTRHVVYDGFLPLFLEGMKGQREELTALRRRVTKLASVSSSSVNSVSVKGLSSTGAVTAHHDLARLLASEPAADSSGHFGSSRDFGDVRFEEVEALRKELKDLREKSEGALRDLREKSEKSEGALRDLREKSEKSEGALRDLREKSEKSEGALRDLREKSEKSEGALRDLREKSAWMESALRRVLGG